MKFILIVCAATIACTYARVAGTPKIKWSKGVTLNREKRADVFSKEAQVGNGKIFGKLGDDNRGLYGSAGYKQDIFNDERGRLQGQGYGTRVLGPAGDSTNFGGRLDWNNQDAKAGLDLSKQVGGRTSLKATGEGVWNFDKNTRLSAGGSVEVGKGKPDIGLQAEFEHKFGK